MAIQTGECQSCGEVRTLHSVPADYGYDAMNVCDECDHPLACPACGGIDIQYLERIESSRKVIAVRDGTLIIDSEYQTDGRDDGDECSLLCMGCGHAFDVPDDLTTEFV